MTDLKVFHKLSNMLWLPVFLFYLNSLVCYFYLPYSLCFVPIYKLLISILSVVCKKGIRKRERGTEKNSETVILSPSFQLQQTLIWFLIFFLSISFIYLFVEGYTVTVHKQQSEDHLQDSVFFLYRVGPTVQNLVVRLCGKCL